MCHTVRTAAALFALSLLYGGADSLAAEGPAVSREQIARWVKDLDAPEFLVRETAMLELLKCGPAVLDPLKPLLEAGGLEATSRALFILRQLGASADEDAQQRSWQLLSELAARQETPVLARRAAASLEELVQQRKTRVLAELEFLGAKIVRGQFFNGIPLDDGVESLELDDAFQGTAEDLRRLKWLHDIPKVVLSGPKVTDAWIKDAAAMPALEELHVYQAKVGDGCLSADFADCKQLRQVGIYYSSVGDQVLAPLTKLPLLSFVKLYGTRLTAKEVDYFRAAVPNVPPQRVDFRRGAFLGVGCVVSDGNCLISTVHEGSPAEVGGFLPRDMVVRFGAKAITSFDELTAEIGRRDVGDEVEVELIRPMVDDQGRQTQKNFVTKVKLAPWELELAVRNQPRP